METESVIVPMPFGRQTLELSISDQQMGQLLQPRSLPALGDVGERLQAELDNGYCKTTLAGIEKRALGQNTISAAIVVTTIPAQLHFIAYFQHCSTS